MSTKHTPGPWTVKAQADSTTVDIVDARGLVVAEVSDTSTEDEANARLIAAAPALLEALRVCATQSTGPDWTPEQALSFIRQHARAAIAAATEEQP